MRVKPRALAAGVTIVASASAATTMLKRTFNPHVVAQPTPWNTTLLELCPTLAAPYSIPALLNNGHIETIFAAWFRRRPHVRYVRELVHMPDGGVVALDTEETDTDLLPGAPVVILLPGLTGGSEDSYVQHAVVHAREAGIRAVVFNSRGTSGSPVTTAQFYSASFTDDLRRVVAHVSACHPEAPIFSAGWSLGANILTKYLGEEGSNTPLDAAVAMCNPFDLPLSDANFRRGFNRIYDWNLARSLRSIYAKHHHLFEDAAKRGLKAFDADLALRARTIREFDDAITRVAFDWPSVDAYYAGSSSAKVIPQVAIPLLVIQAADDPIAPQRAIPVDALRNNPNCILVVTPTGGHLGCVDTSDGRGWRGAPWTDTVVAQFLSAVHKLNVERRPSSQAEPEGVWTVGVGTHQAP